MFVTFTVMGAMPLASAYVGNNGRLPMSLGEWLFVFFCGIGVLQAAMLALSHLDIRVHADSFTFSEITWPWRRRTDRGTALDTSVWLHRVDLWAVVDETSTSVVDLEKAGPPKWSGYMVLVWTSDIFLMLAVCEHEDEAQRYLEGLPPLFESSFRGQGCRICTKARASAFKNRKAGAG
ncbi:MAG: hypothetical protein H7210_11765 [Pyrinomonadaceae bacterium]|nr:hypothetical protein [Phycisphaerales bacterium]